MYNDSAIIEYSLKELVEMFQKRGGKINKYYLQDWNKNKHTIIYLNGWFGGKNIREALTKALLN